MKKFLVTTAMCAWMLLYAAAQPTFVKWYSSYNCGTFFNEVKQTTDGGYIACGTKNPGSGYTFTMLVKTDAWGDTLWTKAFRLGVLSTGNSVCQTADGGYVVTGNSCPNTSWAVYPIVIRMNSNGDTLWTKKYSIGGAGESIRECPGGGFILAGETSSSNSDVFLLRLDTAGNTVWAKTYFAASAENVTAAEITTDHGFVIAGHTYSYGAGDEDIFLMKTDSAGTFSWSRTYGHSGYDYANDVEQTSDNGFILTGHTYLDSLHKGMFLIKTDLNGDTLWTNIFGANVARDRAEGTAVKQTADGGYAVVGNYYTQSSGNDIAFVKTNSAGVISWSSFFGSSPFPNWSSDVIQAADGNYMLCGSCCNFGNVNGFAFLAKTDQNGSTGCFNLPLSIGDTLVPWIVTAPVLPASSQVISSSYNTCYEEADFVPNTDCFTSGVENINYDQDIRIFPDPANDHFTIQFDNSTNEKVEFRLIDMQGRIVTVKEFSSDQQEVGMDVRDVADGIYLLQMETKEGIRNQKIIIQH